MDLLLSERVSAVSASRQSVLPELLGRLFVTRHLGMTTTGTSALVVMSPLADRAGVASVYALA